MRYLLKNANIIYREGNSTKVNILIEGNKIVKTSHENIDVVANEQDLSGYTIMPGFIHTHVHLIDCYDAFNEEKLKKWLLSGITHLRDMGILSRHTTKEAVEWKNKYRNSSLYPSLAVCGKFISAVNGYGGAEPMEISSETEARDAIKIQVDKGVDHIKIALDSGYDAYTQSLDLLPVEILSAICDESHKLGKKVSAHVCKSDNLDVLLKAGIDEAAHACFDPISDNSLDYMVRNNICMTPTLSIYGEILTNWGAHMELWRIQNDLSKWVA